MSGVFRDVLRRAVLCLFIGYALAAVAADVPARSLGPDGGDVRSLAAVPGDPNRIFLGTSSGRMYVSEDGGNTWRRFAHFGQGFDYVLDHIVMDPADPRVMYVAAWSIENNSGELFRSRDGGKNWTSLAGMRGQSIRALAMAPSNSKLLLAGTLEGVFRSQDAGESWKLISPPNHADIKNIESLAIDPRDPNVIYAGTWHLPWKTADGGSSWHPIHKGMIDDSDVFSIIVDPNQPGVVYASACSGIYKSESAGELFRKMQGIPATARRTRVLKQDPSHPNVVYAGTTQGLWKTENAGRTWTRVSSPNLIINDIFVHPQDSSRILLATDRSGVMASRDGARTWMASNRGFTHRQVASILVDRTNPGTVYAGVVNDKEFGGVFVSRDSGASWTQFSRGLGGHDVFALAQDSRGNLLAGTDDSLFRYSPKSGLWMKQAILRSEKVRVTDLDVSGRYWLVASTRGLFYSADGGATWKPQPQMMRESLLAVRSRGQVAAAATSRKLFVSADAGAHWSEVRPPLVSYIQAIALDASETMWIATPQGTFRRHLTGEWEKAPELPRNVDTLLYDDSARALFAIAASSEIYITTDGRSWRHMQNVAVPIRRLASSADRIYAGSRFDGVVELQGSPSRAAAAYGGATEAQASASPAATVSRDAAQTRAAAKPAVARGSAQRDGAENRSVRPARLQPAGRD